jgi:uncharacterized membrane-anchored protein
MTERIRLLVMLAMTVIILIAVNNQIVDKEMIVRHGTTVLLRLAPADPRSLIQGDYMSLRYAMTNDVARAAEAAGVDDGVAVFEPGKLDEANFVAVYAGQKLADDQFLLRFRKRGESVRIASDAFFFEEGQADLYSGARFGELRVADDGDAVLTGLRDNRGIMLGEPLHQ